MPVQVLDDLGIEVTPIRNAAILFNLIRVSHSDQHAAYFRTREDKLESDIGEGVLIVDAKPFEIPSYLVNSIYCSVLAIPLEKLSAEITFGVLVIRTVLAG